jgi:tRNA threonylcarbamoyl adenosine modification protein YeaZ/ribosomal-protein-alanine acetyltransferase
VSWAILAIDTATPAVTAGVVDFRDRRSVLAERVTVDAKEHAARITPNVLAALADAGFSVADLNAVVVGCGPGPFTGLRVGMATAVAYGHALGVPVYGVCSLDAIGVGTSGDTLVVTDARRREVYWARYRDGVRIAGPGVCAPAGVEVGAAQAVAGSPAHAALFGLPVLDIAYPTPAGLVAMVGDWDVDPPPLVPLYLRRPDAKPSAGMPLIVVDALIGADAARCAELETQLFDADDPWPAAAFHRALGARHHHYAAARVGDKLVGYAGIARLGRTPPFEYEVHTIGVDPAYQGRGIGRRLMAGLLDFADGGVVHLEVRTDNAAAIALYRDLGFVEVGIRRHYYRASGADAYMMRRGSA